MLHFFNKIHQHETKILYKKEEFGLLNEIRELPSSIGKGTIQIISYSSWAIYKVQIQESFLKKESFKLNTESNCILLNLSLNQSLHCHFKDNKQYQLAHQTGTFYNTIEREFELDLSIPIDLFILELRKDYLQLGVFDSTLKQLLQSIFELNNRLTFSIDSSLLKFIEEVQQSTKRGVCQLMFLNAKIFEILSELMDKIETKTITKTISHPYQSQLEKVKEIVDAKLHIQISINDLAKQVGLNTSYLKKYFKEYYNETIFEYSTNKRIQLAKELLETTELPIATIADKTGYQQSSHFSYAFKQKTGFTPNKYRIKAAKSF